MRPPTVLLIALVLTFGGYASELSAPSSEQKQQDTSRANQRSPADQHGTEQTPLVSKMLPWFNGVLALVAILQLVVYSYQAKKLRETVEAYDEQSKAMERHIGEAARSATAMEKIAGVIEEGNKAVLRAYLTVTVGAAIYQERREGQPDLKFEARPNLVNTGSTPARKVNMRTKAAILPVPLVDGFEFPEPENREGVKGSSLGAHQNIIMPTTVADFVPDREVPAIKEADRKALYVWGRVTYEDIFGDEHFTRFGQLIQWYPDNSVYGYFLDGQNDSD